MTSGFRCVHFIAATFDRPEVAPKEKKESNHLKKKKTLYCACAFTTAEQII